MVGRPNQTPWESFVSPWVENDHVSWGVRSGSTMSAQLHESLHTTSYCKMNSHLLSSRRMSVVALMSLFWLDIMLLP